MMPLPGMNLLICRWNDSKDVEPLAHLYVGSWTPPLVKTPVFVYNLRQSVKFYSFMPISNLN